MFKIETDYNSNSLSCLISILNVGLYRSCFGCDAKGTYFCIFNEVKEKRDDLFNIYADKFAKEKELHE